MRPDFKDEFMREIIFREAELKARLDLTKMLFTVWCDWLHENDDHAITTAEATICVAAKDEWGINTTCLFDRAQHQITIENFDGRFEVLKSELQ